MKKVSIYRYYQFGYNYRGLRFQNSNITNEKYFESVMEYIEFVNELNLRVTKETLIMNGIIDDLTKLEKLSKGYKKKLEAVDEKLLEKISKKINNADITLDAELNIRQAFILEEKRFSNETLTDTVEKIFSKNGFNKLPDVARYDFEEGCKCLAFDRYTAAAFHYLRGTEDVIKLFYEKLTKNIANDKQTWYNFIDEINKESKSGKVKPKPSEELMTNLDLLRKFYRNKTQHPHLIYSSDDSQDLLTHCVRCINQIIGDLTKRELI